MLLFKILAGFLQALNAKATPRAVAGGVALGALIGLSPTGGVQNIALLLLIFLLPVNKSASIVSALAFAAVAWPAAPLFDRLGYFLLTRPALQGLWTAFYNTPVVPWTRFNNTVVLGGLTTGLLLFAPVFFGATWGVQRYRDRVVAVAAKWRLFQILRASKFYELYEKFS
ncbi:MAG: TIGR03546 family protein [Elusimicrobia bacterium]|jgi:uncharacterized protein (TIGR03546 family)|nr:MAG: TIGR03546 family protein [Elusimicrobiota bacterium]